MDRFFYFPTSPISCTYFTLENCKDLNIKKIKKISQEDAILIKNLYLSKQYGARRLLSELPDRVNNVRKVSHVQHEQYWAKDWALWDRADDEHNRWGTTGVHDSVCPTGQIWRKPHQSCSTQAKLTLKSQQQQLVIDSVEGSC